MNSNLAQQAIDNAISGDWKKASGINIQILANNPDDVEALIRLAKCYFELGNLVPAKKTIQKALKIDPYNLLANKCYSKWKILKSITKRDSKKLPVEMFLEEPGKTKIIHLIHPCDKDVTSLLKCGEMVNANYSGRRVSIATSSGKYIGKIPDDLSLKLRRLNRMGFVYIYAIKSIDNNDIHVFVREIEKPEGYSDIASFSTEKIDYTPYTPPEMLHEKTTITSFNDEADDTNTIPVGLTEDGER